MPAAASGKETRRMLVLLLTTTIGVLAQPPLHDEALRLVREGRYEEARGVLGRLLGDTRSSDSYRAALLQVLGAVENKTGRYAEASQVLERARTLCGRGCHPKVLVSVLVALAEARIAQVNLHEGHQLLRRALSIAESELPHDSPSIASVLDGMGQVYLAQGKHAQAEKLFRRALVLLERNLQPDHPTVAAQATALAWLLVLTGRQAEALPLIEQSRKTLEKAYGLNHPDTVLARYAQGVALLDRDPAEAERVLRSGLTDWLTTQPERQVTTVGFLNALAAATYKQRGFEEAETLCARALELSRDLLGEKHPRVVAQMYAHARVLKSAGKRRQAAGLKKEADRIRTAMGYTEPVMHSIDIRALRVR